MRIRKAAAALSVTTLSLGLAACGSSDSSEGSGGAGDKPYIAIVSKGFQHQFWQAVKKGAEEEANKENARISFEGPATERDVEQQVTMLTNALAKSPKVLGVAALDTKAMQSQLQQAEQSKIPVIAFDSGVESDVPKTTCATDNKAAAAEAAKRLSELLGGKGKVGVIAHDQTSETGKGRQDGFVEWMKKNAPGITVLTPQVGDGDQAKSADLVKAMVNANPDLKGIYGTNEGSAIGIVKGLQELNKTGLKVVGFDSGKAQIDAINSGLMNGAITQNPVGIGQCVVKSAMKALKGEELPKNIDTGYYWYDKTNINDEKIKAVLYN